METQLKDTDSSGTEYRERKSTTTTTSRFDYVKYDEKANELQALFKAAMTEIEADIDANIRSPRAKALALTKLEEVYMWIGKGIRDDQVAARGAELEEGRCNS
jgi:ribosomal protein L33